MNADWTMGQSFPQIPNECYKQPYSLDERIRPSEAEVNCPGLLALQICLVFSLRVYSRPFAANIPALTVGSNVEM